MLAANSSHGDTLSEVNRMYEDNVWATTILFLSFRSSKLDPTPTLEEHAGPEMHATGEELVVTGW